MDLTVSGKNILDEGFSGANVRDKENNNKFSKSGAEFLLENIKKATTPVENTGMRNKDAISSSVSIIAQNLGDNTEAIQKIVDANDESQEEFVKLVKMMSTAQEKTGEASVNAINQLLQQIAKIEIKSGDDSEELIKLLGLDKTKETLSKQSNPLGFAGAAFKKFTNVDVRENDTFGGSLKQAFSKEKLFGLQPKINFEAIQQQREQVEGFSSATGASVADNKETETSKITPAKKTATETVITNAEGGNIADGIDRESLENKQVELLEDILAELKKMSDESVPGGGFLPLRPGTNLRGGTPRPPRSTKPPTNTRPSRFSRVKSALGFADDVPVNPASVKPTLKPGFKLNSAGAPYNASNGQLVSPKNAFTNVADDVARAGTNVADDVVRGASTTSKVLGGTGRLLSKAAIPLTVGMGVYDGYTGYQNADQLVESGATNEETGQAFTEQDETAGKVEAVTSATGGTAGAIAGGSAGAAYGAAIGSIIPGAGTLIGGFLGGAIGGTLGYFAGSKAGEMAGDAATTTSGEAALEAAEDSGLYNKNWVGKSKINPDMLKETTDTAQLNAILADEDLTEKDTNRVIERLSQLDSGSVSGSINSALKPEPIDYLPPPGTFPLQTSVSPTADAVGNMTDATTSQAPQQAPTVINNVTNNNTQASNSAPPVLINPTTARNSVNSFIDFQSRQYTRV